MAIPNRKHLPDFLILLFCLFMSITLSSCTKKNEPFDILFTYKINGVVKNRNHVTSRMFSHIKGNMILIYGENSPSDNESLLLDLDSSIAIGLYGVKESGSNNNITLAIGNTYYKSKDKSGVIKINAHNFVERTIEGQFIGMVYDDIFFPQDSINILSGVFKIKY